MMRETSSQTEIHCYVIPHQHTFFMQLQNKHVLLATQTANWQLLLAVAIPGEDMCWCISMAHLTVVLLFAGLSQD